MAKPTGFLEYARQLPTSRPISERVLDSREFDGKLTGDALVKQSTRCMDCGVPFCHQGCPLGNLIPEFNDFVRLGRMDDAKKRLAKTNNFPEVTGRVCPAPCEAACVLSLSGEPVTIKHIEKAIAAEEDFVPQPPAFGRSERVAIIGSGPAGLAAAQQLRRAGFAVTVFERSDKLGGLLRYGIPDFKLDKRLLDRRLQQLRAEGVRFVTGVEVGKDLSLEGLLRNHDSVGLAVGAAQAREVTVPGRELSGVELAMTYLTEANRAVADEREASMSAKGRHVIILGGGDTGADCVGTAHRQGAASVTQLEIQARPPTERPTHNPWPDWPLVFRTSAAHEEGGAREYALRTTQFVGDAGHVTALECVQVEWRDGQCHDVPGTERRLPADLVLIAAGFTGVDRTPTGVSMTPRQTVQVDGQFATSQRGVFACGDATRGASLVVWAIAEGRQMAASIERHLNGALSLVSAQPNLR